MEGRHYTFREAEEQDLAGIERLFQHSYAPGWASWKYLHNPDGPAQVFVAQSGDGAIVGSLGHIPRRFTSASTGTFQVLQVVDVFLKPELRREGVFLGLLQHALNRMRGPRIGYPNNASGAFAAGLGWKSVGTYESWHYPILAGQLIRGHGAGALTRSIDKLSVLYGKLLLRKSRRLEMRRVTRFERDYALDPEVIHGIRSADYLNWRFIDNPMSTYFAYEFFESGEPIGYCVYSRGSSSATLSDWVTKRSDRSCLRLLIDHCRASRFTHLSFQGAGLRSGALGLRLGRVGFMDRTRDERACLGVETPKGRWLVTACDIDYEPESSGSTGEVG